MLQHLDDHHEDIGDGDIVTQKYQILRPIVYLLFCQKSHTDYYVMFFSQDFARHLKMLYSCRVEPDVVVFVSVFVFVFEDVVFCILFKVGGGEWRQT